MSRVFVLRLGPTLAAPVCVAVWHAEPTLTLATVSAWVQLAGLVDCDFWHCCAQRLSHCCLERWARAEEISHTFLAGRHHSGVRRFLLGFFQSPVCLWSGGFPVVVAIQCIQADPWHFLALWISTFKTGHDSLVSSTCARVLLQRLFLCVHDLFAC